MGPAGYVDPVSLMLILSDFVIINHQIIMLHHVLVCPPDHKDVEAAGQAGHRQPGQAVVS